MKIEKGIPCPYFGRVDGLKYPFERMKVGDSFLISKEIAHFNVRNAYWQLMHRKHLDWKFTIRKTAKGFRCWRIK
jgi:hypothetical protein